MSPATTQSLSGPRELTNHSLGGQPLLISSDAFLAKVLCCDCDQDDLVDLVSAGPLVYRDFSNSINSGQNLQTAVLMLLEKLNECYEEKVKTTAKNALRLAEIGKTDLFMHQTKPKSSATPELIMAHKRVVESWTATRENKNSPHTAMAWHHVATGVFICDSTIQANRVVEFVWALLQARPDLAGTVALAISTSSFQLFWADATTSYASESIPWNKDSIRLLCGFIHRAHNPVTDPSITLDETAFKQRRNIRNATPIHAQRPLWLVEGDDEVYLVDEILAVGKPSSAWKWLGAATRCQVPESSDVKTCPRVVVKDFWPRRSKEVMTEDVVLAHIHAEGVVPGVCEVVTSFCVSEGNDDLQSLPVVDGVEQRRKHRLILDGTSTDIYKCDSILDVLITVYDCLETLKILHASRGVLYRDISLGNVLRRTRLDGEGSPFTEGAIFIGDVLAERYVNPRLRRGPACTIIDYDHSFSAAHMHPLHLTYAAGTPPFIARAVLQEFDITDSSPVPPFPELHGQAKDLYIKAYGLKQYESSHPSPPDITLRTIPEARRHSSPRHDAESCFWLLSYFLATALPEDANVDDDTTVGHRLCLAIDTTELDAPDARASLFEDPETWTECLHPHLQNFGQLIEDLAEQVRPIYDACEEAQDEYHLHNAMQMILFEEICRVLDDDLDVALDTSFRRRVGSLGPFRETETYQGKKRRGQSLVPAREARRMRIASQEE